MAKFGGSAVLDILRQYGVADQSQLPRAVEQLSTKQPRGGITLITFRFLKDSYFLLVGSDILDTEAAILNELKAADVDTTGLVLLTNPLETTIAYGVPYKGKEVYTAVRKSPTKRLDVWLSEHYPEHSRSTWQKYIKAGAVSLNGQPEQSPKAPVSPSSVVYLQLPEKNDFSKRTLPIIYMDDDIVVIDKPAGVLTHAKGAIDDEFTVAEFFKRYTTYKFDTNRPGIIHRLDRDTSGIIVGARTPDVAAQLQKQFAARTVKKNYVALVDGIPKQPEAHIDLPIGRNPSAPSTFRVDERGKPARTYYKVVANTNGRSLVSLAPETGRTHQLRVHMAYIGTPIVGDRVYGKPAERMYLHAHSLELTLPSGERRVFTSPLPPEFLAQFPGAQL